MTEDEDLFGAIHAAHEEERRRAEYYDELHKLMHLDGMIMELKSYGYLVIPPLSINSYLGDGYHVTTKPILTELLSKALPFIEDHCADEDRKYAKAANTLALSIRKLFTDTD